MRAVGGSREVKRGTTRAGQRGRAGLGAALLLLLLAGLPFRAGAQTPGGYVPCLGCAEHNEIRARWHRPLLTELAAETLVMANHFRLENDARKLGMCESDVLIRSPLAVNGCHAYSARRAWLIEAPLELVAVTSPAWGLARRGHPRWAMAVALLPMGYHALSSRATIEAIHQYQRQLFLFH